jgi:hypothetical protein
VLLPVKVIFPVPNAMTRVLELLEENKLQDKAKLPKLNVPKVKVNVPAIVWLAPKVNANVELFKVAVVQVEPLAVVQVPVPDRLSKITVSAATGAEAPLAPPDAVDQFVVLDEFQVPVPPTQYLVAIIYPVKKFNKYCTDT